MAITKGMRVRFTSVAPVSEQLNGCVGTIVNVLPNAVVAVIDGHGGAILHRGWGTKRNPGNLAFDVL